MDGWRLLNSYVFYTSFIHLLLNTLGHHYNSNRNYICYNSSQITKLLSEYHYPYLEIIVNEIFGSDSWKRKFK